MTTPRLTTAVLLVALAVPTHAADAPNLDGTWLFDEARSGGNDDLQRVRRSVVTVKGDRFALTKLWGFTKKNLTGRLVFDPADASAVDLVLDALDFGDGDKVPAGTYKGRVTVTADRLTLSLARAAGSARPAAVGGAAPAYHGTLTRAPAGFKDFPTEITVRVTGPDGRPVADADLGELLINRDDHRGPDGRREWHYLTPRKTDADGTARVPFDAPPLVVRDAAARHVAFPLASPARLAGGELSVRLAPEQYVAGRVVLDACKKAGVDPGKATVLLVRDGRWLAQVDLKSGDYDIPCVPGNYTVKVVGEKLTTESVAVTLPPGKAEVVAPTLDPKPNAFEVLRGKAAPELGGLAGWSGKAVKLADLRGRYVLLEFWGHWCRPCVASMPVLIDLHERFAARGLTVVGVHVDAAADGVDTAEKLDAKIAPFVRTAWKGKALPFPNALVVGRNAGRAPDQYGVEFYPTTILIDREGKVVRRLRLEDGTAVAEIEKLLGGPR